MRVLVTGANGQLGTEVRAACQRAGDVVVALARADLDVTDRDSVLGAIYSVRPDAIIHTAAWTRVDECESDPLRAFSTNALAVRWMAEGARRTAAHLLHISTDYVFSGDQPTPYTEWDETGPVNAYGRSKLAGEEEALAGGIGATVVRTSWVIGVHGANMLKKILRLLDERAAVSFVLDQRGQPTLAADLAPMLRRLAVDRRPGIHHVTSQGPVTRFELAREIARAAGRDPDVVRPIAAADLQPPPPAARPANSVLDNAVLRLSGLPLLPDFREELPNLVRAIRASERR
jgi:dTDP-4-dehydrorhamnose reductase